MSDAAQARRLLTMAFLVVVAFVCLGYRLVELQVLDHDELALAAEKASHRTILWAPKRGEIRDVRGNLLAGSVLVKTVCGNPSVIGEHREEVAQAIAPLLEMSEAEVSKLLRPQVHRNAQGSWVTNRYVVLKTKVPVEVYAQIRRTMKDLVLAHSSLKGNAKAAYQAWCEAAISAEDDQLRVYPNQNLAAQVLGFVGSFEHEGPKGSIHDLQGMGGIELSLDKALRGLPGWRNTEVARSRELVDSREQEVQAHAGRNVILTLDAGVQHIVESELANAMEKHSPISASAIVVRPRTGEILAMATLPTFNPNDFAAAPPDSQRLRIVTDLAEPGSTFKIVVISGALNDGTVTLDDRFDCENGHFNFAGTTLHDHEPYGILSVQEIVMHSSNIGAAKVGLRMGPQRLYHYIREFGFGTKTDLPLPYEPAGGVRPIKDWTKVSISRIPMGHEVSVTPIQMVMAMCAVANNGRLMRPLLVDRLEDEEGHALFRYYPQTIRQVISPAAARLMVSALKTVVSTNSGATGRKAMLEHYTVAGKTGTAQKIVDGKYSRTHHFSSFIGFFPADDPELCVAVFLDDPKHGYYAGEPAAPVFHDIAERAGEYLAIKSDIAPPPALPAAPAPLATGSSSQIRTASRF